MACSELTPKHNEHEESHSHVESTAYPGVATAAMQPSVKAGMAQVPKPSPVVASVRTRGAMQVMH